MRFFRLLAACSVAVALTACHGGSSAIPFSSGDANATGVEALARVAPGGVVDGSTKTYAITFDVAKEYLPKGSDSLVVELVSVNGKKPTVKTTTTVTSISTCAKKDKECTVSGPASPAGTDVFDIKDFDEAKGAGSALAAISVSYKIAKAATEKPALDGIAKKIALSIPSGASAGTAATLKLTLKAVDAKDNLITGGYYYPIALADSDSTGATELSDGGKDSTKLSVTKATEVIELHYSGLAIASAAIKASETGVESSVTESFKPTSAGIVVGGAITQGEVDLYDGSGPLTFTATEAGWTGSFGHSIDVSVPSSCGSIGTVSPSSGTSFTATAVSNPTPGTCQLALTGGGGASTSLPLTYTTTSVIISGKHAHPRP
jgi:hypothetical protein